jgi:hypothetical protein
MAKMIMMIIFMVMAWTSGRWDHPDSLLHSKGT